MKFRGILSAFLALVVISFASCKGDGPEDPSGEGYDKEAMLQNIGEQVILASYIDLQNSVEGLVGKAEAFGLSKDETSLDALRDQFTQAHLAWQLCSLFEFGPAADANLRLSLNTFPADTSRIESNIETGNLTFDGAQDAAAKGFPALDVVFFNYTSKTAAVAALSDSNRWAYAMANINYIKDLVDEVTSKWQDTYLNDFKTNTGSSVGSSLGLMVNELNYDFELLKNAKIGIPLGKKTLGITQTDKVEAPFSGNSLAMTKANLEGLKNAFTGAEGEGLDDYLNALGAQYNGEDLSTQIINGFDESMAALNAIDTDLVSAIENSPSDVESAYASLQNLVVLLKVDMPSQLGVQITYQDNDGD